MKVRFSALYSARELFKFRPELRNAHCGKCKQLSFPIRNFPRLFVWIIQFDAALEVK